MNTTSHIEEVPTARHLLRHAVATIAYRGGKALRNAPESFADFHASESTRTPGQILAHVGDLLEWSARMVAGENTRAAWHPVPAQGWNEDLARFYAALSALDASLASEQPLGISADILFQGPISDAFTHIGQLAMLRHMAGARVKSEVMVRADVVVGRVGAEQTASQFEFD
jgi:hypothetical protein